jgi:hypothetical protein
MTVYTKIESAMANCSEKHSIIECKWFNSSIGYVVVDKGQEHRLACPQLFIIRRELQKAASETT